MNICNRYFHYIFKYFIFILTDSSIFILALLLSSPSIFIYTNVKICHVIKLVGMNIHMVHQDLYSIGWALWKFTCTYGVKICLGNHVNMVLKFHEGRDRYMICVYENWSDHREIYLVKKKMGRNHAGKIWFKRQGYPLPLPTSINSHPLPPAWSSFGERKQQRPHPFAFQAPLPPTWYSPRRGQALTGIGVPSLFPGDRGVIYILVRWSEIWEGRRKTTGPPVALPRPHLSHPPRPELSPARYEEGKPCRYFHRVSSAFLKSKPCPDPVEA